MESLIEGNYYHIYNRGNNKQNIFLEEDNYLHFMKLLGKYILPIAKVYCYCLLKNHFHLIVKIKEEVEKPSQAFSNLFNAYTKAFNKRFDRTGSLFQRPFRRIKINNEQYLKSLIIYIHLNPETHGLSNDFKSYTYSSYKAICSNQNTNIEKDLVINLFHDIDNFMFVHEQHNYINDEKLKELILE